MGGYVIVYDVTNLESFEAVEDWLAQILFHNPEAKHILLVGNKTDKSGSNERVVSLEKGWTMARQIGAKFAETSAKLDTNVDVAFKKLVDLVCQEISEQKQKDSRLYQGYSEQPNLRARSSGYTKLDNANDLGSVIEGNCGSDDDDEKEETKRRLCCQLT